MQYYLANVLAVPMPKTVYMVTQEGSLALSLGYIVGCRSVLLTRYGCA
jgi:hypothetical protein